jgi:DivIVA domain-containing protein
MPLTPAEVHNVAFKKPPIGKRGYDEEEVDAFLDVVETELARLIEENNDLRSRGDGADGAGAAGGESAAEADGLREENRRLQAQLAQLESTASQGRDGVPPDVAQLQQELAQTRQRLQEAEAALAEAQRGGAGSVDPNTQAVGVLALAQQTAEQHVSQAKAEAERLLTQAREEAERTLSDAHQRSTQQVSEAETRARQLDAESSGRAARTVQEAEQRAATIGAQFEQRKAALERRVEELRMFEREYRSRLRSYLESQLRDLDAGGRAEPAGAPSEMADSQHG